MGHSERRQFRGYTNEHVAAKVSLAYAAGLVPLICVGETKEQRDAGIAAAVIQEQVAVALNNATAEKVIISYEPVWAIGADRPAQSHEITEMHDIIKKQTNRMGIDKLHILYGGAVNTENAREVLTTPGVDGVLVGRAALDPDQFISIAKLAESLP